MTTCRGAGNGSKANCKGASYTPRKNDGAGKAVTTVKVKHGLCACELVFCQVTVAISRSKRGISDGRDTQIAHVGL